MLIHAQKTSSKNFFLIFFFLILIGVSSFIIYYHFYFNQSADVGGETDANSQMLPRDAASVGSDIAPVGNSQTVQPDNKEEQWQLLQSGLLRDFNEIKVAPVKQKQGRSDIFTPKF